MPDEDALDRIDRFERFLVTRPDLALRVCCPSQEFTREEMSHGVGRWFSGARGLWESLTVAREPGLAVVMLQAPPVPDPVVDHLLGLRPGDESAIADRRRRHLLVGIDDDSEVHLSEKLLARPHLLDRLRALVTAARERGQRVDRLSGYQSSTRMDAVAAALGLEQRETPSATLKWGTKAGSRQLFASAGVPHPPGTYRVSRDLADLAGHAADLCRRHGPGRWLLKINEGFGTGHGNALVTVDRADADAVLRDWEQNLVPMVKNTSRADFLGHVAAQGAILERFREPARGGEVRAPSTLFFVEPSSGGADIRLLGTHDQVMGGELDFTGGRFPADAAYRQPIIDLSRSVVEELVEVGVRGHVGIDFLARRADRGRWDLDALEINLRQTGTTHPNRTVRALVTGTWHADGTLTHRGSPVCYESTDGLVDPSYRAITPDALIAGLTASPDLRFDPDRAQGVVPHLWTALRPFGKIGATFIGGSGPDCGALREGFVDLLAELAESSRVKAAGTGFRGDLA
ncbi:hypothetical protein AB0425_40880 [Actinosynnema sp. NPDC051121]